MNDFHGASGPPPVSTPEPTLAQKARTLVHLGGASSLATMSKKHPDYPFASVMPYAADEQGQPVFLISSMAMHTKNIRSQPKATLLIADQSSSSPAGSLGAARISLIGDVLPVEDAETQSVAASYLSRHPQAQQWANFGDFQFFRMNVIDVYFVGGFGVMGWITADDYKSAAPDPLAEIAAGIISHMNEDHMDSMILLAANHLGVQATAARMTAVDHLGFNLALMTDEGMRGGRIAFPEPILDAEATRQVFVEMVKSARS